MKRQTKLFKYMLAEFRQGRECKVTDMYRAIYEGTQNPPEIYQLLPLAEAGNGYAHRRIQQCVGSYVSSTNKRLRSLRIVPGDKKRTYKLIPAHGFQPKAK